MNDNPKIVSFDTTLSSFGKNTGIKIPDEIIEKFIKIYPAVAEEERRKIPQVLIEYYNQNK